MAGLTVILLMLGVALLVAEVAVSARGVLATTGVGALVAGIALALLDELGTLAVALVLTAPVVAALAALAVLTLRLGVAAGRAPVRCGAEGVVGHIGVVRRRLDPLGQVAIDGELWRARRSWGEQEAVLVEGDPVVVDRVDGLTLAVRRAETWEVEP